MPKDARPPAGGKRQRKKQQWKPPKLKRIPITLSKRLRVACLQANYGVSDERGVTRIHALTPEGRAGKEQFQRDAWRYIHALGKALALAGGFTEQRLSKNPAGPAGAGSVMAAYYHPTLPCWLNVYIEADRARTALPRPDGVTIIACRRTSLQAQVREPLFHLNPAMSSTQLAHVLLLLVGVRKGVDFERENQPAPVDGPAPQAPFGVQDGGMPGTVIRCFLLGRYRQCLLLKPGRTSVEVVCIDNHPSVALGYWGKRMAQPLARVHPEDQPLCALPGAERIPGQAHLAPGDLD